MTVKKIYIIFFSIILAAATILIYLDIRYPDLLGRFRNLAENGIAGLIGALIITFLLDFSIAQRQEKATQRMASVGLIETCQVINRLLAFTGTMIKASSNEFIPYDIDALFSNESQELVSLHLGIDKLAPNTSKTSWRYHIQNECKFIHEQLGSIQQRYYLLFSEDVLGAIGELYNNPLLNALMVVNDMDAADKRFRVKRPVLNIPLDQMSILMTEILRSVKKAERYTNKLNLKIKIQFPSQTFRSDFLPKLGDSRYDGQPGPGYSIGVLPGEHDPK